MTVERHEVASTDEFAEEGDRVIVDVDGVEVAVFRVDGEYHALTNFCVHQGGPLCEGELHGRITVRDDGWLWGYDESQRCIVCPWHAWKFDVTTGRNVNDDRYRVPTFETVVEDETVYVLR